MWRYIIHRVLGSLPTLFALATITFFILRLAPGGPFSDNRRLTPEALAALNRAYHFDEPVLVQYGRYLWNLLHFDFGPSIKYRDSTVGELILKSLPVSLEIGLWAMIFSTVIGIALGLAGALRRNGVIDYGAGAIAMVGLAIPVFVIGPVLQIAFGLDLHWLPVAGWDGSFSYKILPIAVLTLPNIAYVSRLTRGSMIETIRTNYVRTARAKGIGERKTILKHAMKGAMLPVVAYLGPATAVTITGSIAIEQIFQIPGIGRYFITAAQDRDYALVMGVTLFYGAIVVLGNMLSDIARGLLDPKVSYE
jgi:oligopeptide transport system permease protein